MRPAALDLDELRELGRLYRLHSAALARLRSDGEDPEAVRAANALVVRAYTLLYSSPSRAPSARRALSERLAEALGRSSGALALAWLLLLAGIVVGLALGLRDPEAIVTLVPPGLGYGEADLEHLVESPEARERFFARGETASSLNAFFGSALFTHNTRIGLLAFATGILAGIPTVLLQLRNGLVLGVFAAVFLRDPWPVDFFAWILPHGIPEFAAIALCTAGGLQLGGAVVAPGRESRGHALRAALDSALVLLGMAVLLFLLAAVMESFVRESALSTATRLAIAAAEAALLTVGTLCIRRLGGHDADTSWLRSLTLRDRIAPPGSGSAAAP